MFFIKEKWQVNDNLSKIVINYQKQNLLLTANAILNILVLSTLIFCLLREACMQYDSLWKGKPSTNLQQFKLCDMLFVLLCIFFVAFMIFEKKSIQNMDLKGWWQVLILTN